MDWPTRGQRRGNNTTLGSSRKPAYAAEAPKPLDGAEAADRTQPPGTAEAHDRVKAMLYYRGVDPDNNYNLQFYPGAREALRNHLAELPAPPVTPDRPQARVFP